MDIPEQNDTFEQQPNSDVDEQSASFKKTFDSLETLLGSKIIKLIASKDLVVAEAKLSLSAILLSFAISLTLVVITAMVWMLLNIGLGLLVYHMSLSLNVPIILLLIINAGLAWWLFKQLKNIWKLVGFHSTITEVISENT